MKLSEITLSNHAELEKIKKHIVKLAEEDNLSPKKDRVLLLKLASIRYLSENAPAESSASDSQSRLIPIRSILIQAMEKHGVHYPEESVTLLRKYFIACLNLRFCLPSDLEALAEKFVSTVHTIKTAPLEKPGPTTLDSVVFESESHSIKLYPCNVAKEPCTDFSLQFYKAVTNALFYNTDPAYNQLRIVLASITADYINTIIRFERDTLQSGERKEQIGDTDFEIKINVSEYGLPAVLVFQLLNITGYSFHRIVNALLSDSRESLKKLLCNPAYQIFWMSIEESSRLYIRRHAGLGTASEMERECSFAERAQFLMGTRLDPEDQINTALFLHFCTSEEIQRKIINALPVLKRRLSSDDLDMDEADVFDTDEDDDFDTDEDDDFDTDEDDDFDTDEDDDFDTDEDDDFDADEDDDFDADEDDIFRTCRGRTNKDRLSHSVTEALYAFIDTLPEPDTTKDEDDTDCSENNNQASLSASMLEAYRKLVCPTGDGTGRAEKKFVGIFRRTEANPYYDFILKTDKNLYGCKCDFAFKEDLPIDDGAAVFVCAKRVHKRLLLVSLISGADSKIIYEKFGKTVLDVFNVLEPELQESILDQLGVETERGLNRTIDFSQSLSGLSAKFKLCEHTYPEKTRKKIKLLLNRAKILQSDRNGTRHLKVMEQLQYLLSINTSVHPERVTKDQMRAALEKKLYGQSQAKAKILTGFSALCRSKNKKGFSILLLSKPGTGKTALATAVAEARQKPYFYVRCGQLNKASSLIGCETFYESATPGLITFGFGEASTTDCTVILDQLDKTNYECSKEESIETAFQDILDGYYEDKFLACEISLNSTWIIATASDETKIPEAIKSRFDLTIQMDDYNMAEQITIGRDYILPRLLEEYSISPQALLVPDDILQYILDNYCLDSGARDLKNNLAHLVKAYIAQVAEDDASVTISEKMADQWLSASRNDKAIVIKQNLGFFDSEADRNAVLDWIEMFVRDSESAKREKARERIDFLSDFFQNTINISDYAFDAKAFRQKLDATHSGMEDLKQVLTRVFHHFARTKTGPNLLLYGIPGSGKTSVIASACRAAGLPYCKISLNGVNDPAFFKGTSIQYQNNTLGTFLSKIQKIGKYGVVQLDELDKMEQNVAVTSVLLDLLDEKKFFNWFLNFSADLKGIIFIATANDLARVSPEIKDRFSLFAVNGYSKAEQQCIFKEHVFPKALNDAHCTNSLSFTEEAVKLLVNDYLTTAGIRDLERFTQDIVEDALLQHGDQPHIISTKEVKKSLGKAPLRRNLQRYKKFCGVVNGLCVNSGGVGECFAIEAVQAPQNKITGLAQECLKESFEIAYTLAGHVFEPCAQEHFHVHLGEGAVPKDGPSAGLTILIAILSAASGIAVDSKYAMTAELDLHGELWPVGGELAKIQAAAQSGCTTVFIPIDNMNEKVQELADTLHIEIVPVHSAYEVIERVFEGKL